MNPAGLDFIDITYDEAGQPKRLLVSPYERLLGAPADWNRHVHEWWSAISDATVAATGHAPKVTPASQLGTPRSSRWLLMLMLLPVIAGVVLLLVMLDSPARLHIAGRPPSSGPGLIGVIVLTLAAITPLFWPRRAAASAEAAFGSASAIGLGAVLFAVLVLVARPGFFEVLILMALPPLVVIGLKRWRRNRARTAASASPPTDTALNATLFALALGLTILFAGPHYAVLGSGHIMVWEVGLPGPWLTDMLHVFPPHGGQQRVREMNLDRPSFYCGFTALTAWMLWIRMRSHGGGAAVFEVVQPSMAPGGRPRVRWGTLALVWISVVSLSVIGSLLVCVLMRHVLGDFPAPAPLLVFAVFPVSLVLLLGVRQGLQQGRRE